MRSLQLFHHHRLISDSSIKKKTKNGTERIFQLIAQKKKLIKNISISFLMFEKMHNFGRRARRCAYLSALGSRYFNHCVKTQQQRQPANLYLFKGHHFGTRKFTLLCYTFQRRIQSQKTVDCVCAIYTHMILFAIHLSFIYIKYVHFTRIIYNSLTHIYMRKSSSQRLIQ